MGDGGSGAVLERGIIFTSKLFGGVSFETLHFLKTTAPLGWKLQIWLYFWLLTAQLFEQKEGENKLGEKELDVKKQTVLLDGSDDTQWPSLTKEKRRRRAEWKRRKNREDENEREPDTAIDANNCCVFIWPAHTVKLV